MRPRYSRPTKRELAGSHLLHLTLFEVGSGAFSDGLKRSVKRCLDDGADIETVAGLISSTPEKINEELKENP